MRGYIELTNKDVKVLLPVGSFEVWQQSNGGAIIQPTSCHCERDINETAWTCEEPYEKVKHLIFSAMDKRN